MTAFVTLGEASLRLSPPGHGRLETARRLEVHVTGAESNAAVVASRLGCDATWISRLPDTPLGRRVAGELREYGLDVEVTWASGRQGLTFYERAGEPRGDRRIEDRANSAVADATARALPLSLAESADVAYATGLSPSISPAMAGAAATFLKTAAQSGVRTAFGLNFREELWDPTEARETLTALFPVVDVFLASERDVAAVLDREGRPSEVAHGLATEWDFETVALWRDHGASIWQDATLYDYPWPKVDVVDPTGADDAFAGALVAALLDGDDASRALKTGMAAASLARTVPGPVATLDAPDVERVAATVGEDD
ncbi:MAG: sugar kinase [Haloarculaceae archaeon]